MLSMGTIAMTSGDPPKGSRQAPTTMPFSASTRVTTSRMSADDASSPHCDASKPFVFGFAFRTARLRLAGALVGMNQVYYPLMKIPRRWGGMRDGDRFDAHGFNVNYVIHILEGAFDQQKL